ncbi:MAG: LTA synthase family protein, partial [Peptococcaceae bacterium]|nr:LTA synthase family protein [Peptococcaceae bacterium]
CNYDIEEAYYESISVNYLSTLAMEVAGVELPVYNQYLSRLYETLPVVNALGYRDSEGVWHYFREENALTPYLNGYELVQYDYLFGGRNRVNTLYQVN